VGRSDLPDDLANFYTWNEGIGLGCDSGITVRLCKLDELRRMKSNRFDFDFVPLVWRGFEAIRIGLGTCGEEVAYVLSCPSAPPGSILAFGDHCIGWGGGGEGPDSLESTLVLAPTFDAWLAHMERWGWEDPILAGVGEWKGQEKQELREYYLMHNPQIDWPPE
jgi:hypothetical protein